MATSWLRFLLTLPCASSLLGLAFTAIAPSDAEGLVELEAAVADELGRLTLTFLCIPGTMSREAWSVQDMLGQLLERKLK